MFKIISRIIADKKAQSESYRLRAARICAETEVIEDETQAIKDKTKEIEAETKTILARAEKNRKKADEFMRRNDENKISLFNEYAERIDQVKDPELREKMMHTLVESSMGKAARRRFH